MQYLWKLAPSHTMFSKVLKQVKTNPTTICANKLKLIWVGFDIWILNLDIITGPVSWSSSWFLWTLELDLDLSFVIGLDLGSASLILDLKLRPIPLIWTLIWTWIWTLALYLEPGNGLWTGTWTLTSKLGVYFRCGHQTWADTWLWMWVLDKDFWHECQPWI